MRGDADFDVLLIGAGQAALPLAGALSAAGRRVAVAERRHLGGSCVNFGCTPSKAVIASARAAHQARRGAAYGLRIPQVEVDFPAVLGRARSLLLETRGHLLRGFAPGGNPRLLEGHARLAGREAGVFRVDVGGTSCTARQVVLDTGTRTAFPPIPGLERLDVLHAGNWLDRPELPEHLAILGAGFVGLEMAQFYRRMGSRVTVLEKSRRILKAEDADVAAALQAMLESEGIQLRMATRVERVTQRKGGGLHLATSSLGARGHLDATHLFVAAGRRPNTDDLGLDSVGLRLPRSGFVPVNARLATPVKGLWAAGDVRGGAMFTHTAWDDFRVLESQLLGDGSRTTRRLTPYALFTDPELGRVGITEEQARRWPRRVIMGRFEMRRNSKARERGDTVGFVKVLYEERSERLLGAAVLAADGSELVHLLVDLMTAGAPASALRDAVHIHPTLAEAVQSAVTPPAVMRLAGRAARR